MQPVICSPCPRTVISIPSKAGFMESSTEQLMIKSTGNQDKHRCQNWKAYPSRLLPLEVLPAAQGPKGSRWTSYAQSRQGHAHKSYQVDRYAFNWGVQVGVCCGYSMKLVESICSFCVPRLGVGWDVVSAENPLLRFI